MYKRFLKRLFDLLASIFLLIIFSPILIFIAFVLAFYNKGQILFIQPRIGKNEKPFLLYKFQTLKPDPLGLSAETDRITKIGDLLRKSSLDEIPQLLNVLLGEMSIVGPRPLLPEYLPLYNSVQKKRHEVLPGITGWAQVNGRNSISWSEKFEFDVYYVANLSLLFDLKIVWITLIKLFETRHVYNKGSIVEKFNGQN